MKTECGKQDEKAGHIRVSVVVPVYNVQQYLKECMDSILAQEMKEIEVICIDDGSTDNSSVILDEYAGKDGRVKVFHIQNGGYGHGVNMGLNSAKGNYVSIVEPDDYIEKGMLKKLYEVCEEYELDMVSSNHRRFTGEGDRRVFKEFQALDDVSFYNRVIDSNEERDIFKGHFINPAGMFRREFLDRHHIRHNETPGASYQDVGFCFQTLAYARRVMVLPQAFYCYRQDNAQSSINNIGKLDCVIKEYAFILDIMKRDADRLWTYLPEYSRRKMDSYLYTYTRVGMELKLKFLKTISRELKVAMEKGEFVTEGLSDGQKSRLRLIIEDAEAFYSRDDILGREIHDRLRDWETFIIYGAGVFGKKILEVLPDGDKDKLEGFAVTSAFEAMEECGGIPVRGIDFYTRELPVVIGVTERYEKEVIDLLHAKGWKKIIRLDSSVLFW